MNYWEKRQKQLNQELEKDEKKLKKKLSSFYSAEYRKLEKEIAAYYSIYGEDKVIEYRKLMQNLDDAVGNDLSKECRTLLNCILSMRICFLYGKVYIN